jgi:hypothetical protein
MEPGRLGAVLARREAENYIPPNALEAWAQALGGNDQSQTKRAARGLRKRSQSERAHIDMKGEVGEGLCRRFLKQARELRDESNELHDILDRLLRRL